MLTLGNITIYPVKGLRGLSLREAEVEPWGLEHDRRWMIVDPAGLFLSQRQVPHMAAVLVELLPWGLRLSLDGEASIEEGRPDEAAKTLAVTLWKDVVPARAASDRAAAWLTRVLGLPCRLVYMADPAAARRTDPAFSRDGDHVSFADGFPLLATTTASLDGLNRTLASPVGMDRFRPNVVVEGAGPWDEDRWSRLKVGEVEFAVVKDCARCVVTTVDQRTGVKADDGEPLRTLARYRRKAGGRIVFGQNIIPRCLGRIRVGDVVEAVDIY